MNFASLVGSAMSSNTQKEAQERSKSRITFLIMGFGEEGRESKNIHPFGGEINGIKREKDSLQKFSSLCSLNFWTFSQITMKLFRTL